MRISSKCGLLLAFALSLLLCGSAQSQDVLKGKARWEWALYNSKGKKIEDGKFMGYVTGEIKHGTNQDEVGKWKAVKPNVVSVTFNWKGKLEGSGELTLKKDDPVTYEGTFERKTGKKTDKGKLVVVLKKD